MQTNYHLPQLIERIREKCYEVLSIAEPNKVIDGIDLLAQDLGREITVRTFSETISSFPGSAPNLA
jgi:hypothetical protein